MARQFARAHAACEESRLATEDALSPALTQAEKEWVRETRSALGTARRTRDRWRGAGAVLNGRGHEYADPRWEAAIMKTVCSSSSISEKNRHAPIRYRQVSGA